MLLDNMDPPLLAVTVTRVRQDARQRGAQPPLLEASGGINLETIAALVGGSPVKASSMALLTPVAFV